MEFLSTPSARRATKIYRIGDVSRLISIHALREEGDGGAGRQDRDEQVISIHALREEGDRPLMITSSHLPYISIHALREEGDSSSGVRKSICLKFLSTPSARRATKTFVLNSVHGPVFLSTPSARRATAWKAGDDEKQAISIHALREEGDRATHVLWWMSWKFLSTPSARRATTSALLCLLLSLRFLSTPSARRATRYNNRMPRRAGDFYPRPPRGGRPVHPQQPLWAREISIHALREEGDGLNAFRITAASYFYPRPPRGGRRSTLVRFPLIRWHFYPRPPRGGRLDVYGILADYTGISIHALREEGDCTVARSYSADNHFYPRPPRGGRPGSPGRKRYLKPISIHALREEGDMPAREREVSCW